MPYYSQNNDKGAVRLCLIFLLFVIFIACNKRLDVQPLVNSATNTTSAKISLAISKLPEKEKVGIYDISRWVTSLPANLPFTVDWSKAKQTIIDGKHVVRVPIQKNSYLVLFKGRGDSLNVYSYAYAPDKNLGRNQFTGGVVSFSFQDYQLRGQIFKNGISTKPAVFESKYDAFTLKSYQQHISQANGNTSVSSASTQNSKVKVNSIFGDILHTIGNLFGALGCTMTGGSWDNGPGGSWSNNSYGSWAQSCSGQFWNWNWGFSGGAYGPNDENAPTPNFVLTVFDAPSGYTYTFDQNHMDPHNPIITGGNGGGGGDTGPYIDYGTADLLTTTVGLTTDQRAFLLANPNKMYYLYNYLQDATTYKDRYDNYKYMSQDLVVNIIKKHIQLLLTDPDYFAFDYTFSGPNSGFILRSDWWDEVIENYNTEFIAIPNNADIANSRGYLGKLGLESDPLANANIETNDETVGGYDQTDYGTYQQGTSWPNIDPIVNSTKFVKYDGENCLTLAKRQLAGLGFQISGYGAPGQTYNANIYPGGVNISETKAGVAYMRGALQAGIPVIVGIDYMSGVPVDRNGNPANPDLKTDHFVVIVGMGSDANGKFFRFYDSATAARVIGTSANNKLYYNETTGVISGTTEVAFAEAFRRGVPQYRDNNNKVIYTITHIRRSKSL